MVHGTTVARDESITVYASSRWKPLTPRGSKRLLMGLARRLSQQMWYNCACYMVWVFCVGFTMFTQSDSAKKSYDSFILHGLTFYEMSWLGATDIVWFVNFCWSSGGRRAGSFLRTSQQIRLLETVLVVFRCVCIAASSNRSSLYSITFSMGLFRIMELSLRAQIAPWEMLRC